MPPRWVVCIACCVNLRTLRPAIQTFRHASHFTSILFLISKRMSVFSAREKFGEHVRDVKAIGGDVMADCNRPFRKIPQYSLFVPHKHYQRNWQQCFCKIWGDKQGVLWYFPKLSIVFQTPDPALGPDNFRFKSPGCLARIPLLPTSGIATCNNVPAQTSLT